MPRKKVEKPNQEELPRSDSGYTEDNINNNYKYENDKIIEYILKFRMKNIKKVIYNTYRFLCTHNFIFSEAVVICLIIGQKVFDPIKIIHILIYVALYEYQFQVGNEIVGIEEDKINKPYRQIACGIISIKEAKYHACMSIFLYLIYGYFLNVFFETISFVLSSLLLNYTFIGKNGFLKNLLMFSAGYTIMVAPLRIIYEKNIMELSSIFNQVIIINIITIFVMIPQDLRDLNGDLKVGRKTLPILFGMKKAINISIFLIVISILLLFYNSFYPLTRIINNKYYFILNLVPLIMVIIELKLNNVKKAYEIYSVMWFCIAYITFPIISEINT